uniref:Inositol 1,4,5-trisphosphate receptor n=1 Tax=Anthurium amnicola TaxID=1678845 RepID=A0A1D1YXU3_9ARAE
MSSTISPNPKANDIETVNSSFGDIYEQKKKMDEKLVGMSVVRNTSSADQYKDLRPGKGPIHYLTHPKELRDEHPVWHYFYLCTLIFAAFVSLFIGPVIFGMLAAIGGIGTPFILSMMGSGIGLLLGLVFGVIFAVVCIVALVRAVGFAAEWVLDTLWYGGNDLLELTKEKVLALINDNDSN